MNTTEQDTIRAAWDAIATGYDRYVTPTHQSLSNEVIARVGVRAGESFLDVAAGSGALSFPAARAGAKVTATDLSSVMVERLAERAAEQGFEDFEPLVMDGHTLEFPDDAFDVAGSQFGVMLFPDLPLAMSEMVRVTKPGGRVVMVVYGAPTQVEFLGFFLAAAKAVVPDFVGLPADPPPLPFQVADPDRLTAALADAGLSDITLDTTTETLEFASGADMWEWLGNSNPIGAQMIGSLTTEQQVEVRKVLDGMLRERAGARATATLINPVHIAYGTK